MEKMNQLEADEIFAKRLQEQFDAEAEEESHTRADYQQPVGDALNSSNRNQGNTSKAPGSNNPEMSDSDSDVTFVDEDQVDQDQLRPAESSSANQSAATLQKVSSSSANQSAASLPKVSSSASQSAASQQKESSLANRSAALLQKVSSPKRILTAHDISDSDSDESDTERPPGSLLERMKHGHEDQEKQLHLGSTGASSSSTSSSSSGRTDSTPASTSTSKPYKIPRLSSTSPSLEPSPVTTTGESKPKCQYGAQCYRKNPSHRRDFRHTDDDGEEGMPPLKKLKKDDGSSSPSPVSLSRRRNCLETVRDASPLCFLLSRVTGIPEKLNNALAVHISDILSPCMGDLVASVQFNYLFDIPWLVEQYPSQFRSRPLLIVHGEQRQSKVALHEAAHPYPNVKLCRANLDIMYGTHHSKMMLLLYTGGMRVVIHTANMIDRDWFQKTQGVWVSPLFPKATGSSSTDSATCFQHDLVEYLAAYRSPSLREWIDHIKDHDMSQAKVHIIASVPGRHTGTSINKWGHLKLRQVLKNVGPKESAVKDWPVIGQFSSVGSLGPDKDKWLCGEWLQSMAQCQGVGSRLQREAGNKALKLIFPSKDNIRTSLEGYPAGGSVPYSIKTAQKQRYFNSFLHQWSSSTRGRSRASPHIKTYSRLSPDSQYIAWFLATSANMSKAAWGALEKNGQQLMIRSYEIGVLFLPSRFDPDITAFSVGEQTASSVSGGNPLYFPLPWDVPLRPYSKEDRPWVWDIPYTDLPDRHGNCWVPPS